MTHERFDEREWLAQERARIAARDGTPVTADPLAVRYRRIADALRAPLPDGLAPDFAAQLARRVQADAISALPDPRFERGMLRVLVTIFGLVGAVVAATYGAQWIPPVLDLLRLDSAAAIHWALALGACVGASWLVDALRRHGKASYAA